jgi:2-oxoglutarate dehydrogenase complex dehydrogenase (E1) component-like enzyme
LRRAQHAGLPADDAGPDLPPAAPADDPDVPQAAGDPDAQVAAAEQGCGVTVAGPRARRLPDRETAAGIDPKAVRKVVLCTGKVYYDLLAARRERELTDVALLRMEQLYPFPHKTLEAELRKYPGATQIVWCQDEPQNQGAWFFMQHHLNDSLKEGQRLSYAGRPASASPAVGYYDKHYAQQKDLLTAALGDAPKTKTKKAS